MSADIHVNGQRQQLDVDPETPLVYVLRNDLGLKGVRPGCSVGVCGSCTVIADGSAIRSCDTPVSAVEGQQITTPEGLGVADRPHAVQATFMDEQAAQCGFCINGIIMSTAAAVARGDTRSETVPDWLEEHLCRCGTHQRVLRAIDRSFDGDVELAEPVGSAVPSAEAAAPEEVSTAVEGREVSEWVRLLPDGRIGVCTGKVELGQGIRTAMAQIAAAHIGIPLAAVEMVPIATGDAPDEGFTAGSNSVDSGGAALACAAVAFVRLLRERAAESLGIDADSLTVDPERLTAESGESISFAEIADAGPITGRIGADDRPRWDAAPLGDGLARPDLERKLTGSAAYVHDLDLPGMLHARAALPPSPTAQLTELDVSPCEAMPGVVRVIVDDRLIIVVAEREEQAVRAAARVQREATWEVPDTGVDSRNIYEHLRTSEPDVYVAGESDSGAPDESTHQATYTQPYQAHAAISPSCSVAIQDEDNLRVYTHSQGIYPLRDSLAGLLGVDLDELELVHADGPGCYGHNLADDAAAFAAVAARELAGTPVRFQFTMEDEFGWEPLGPAMIADLRATLQHESTIGYWSHHTFTDVHSTRPNGNPGRLIAGWLGKEQHELDWPGAHEGGARDTVPIYDLPAIDAVGDHVRGPLRTSALRTLGSYLNTFAAESFMDELAELAERDALEFRLAHLSDPRARRVLEVVAEQVGWEAHVGPSGRGLGLAVARYKGSKAYVAEAVEASIDPTTAKITVHRLHMVCDAGSVVNADGLVNQLEGGALQGLSRALHEEMGFDGRTVTTRDWLSYPVLGFGEVPSMSTVLIDAGDHPPLGAGEASVGPAAAALANAIDDAIGVRLRELPLTPKRVEERLFALTENESARVLLE